MTASRRTNAIAFELRCDPSELRALAGRYFYPSEARIEDVVAPATRSRGYVTREHLQAFARWMKLDDRRMLIPSNTPAQVEAASRRALTTRNEEERLTALQELSGVGPGLASIILHWTQQDPYPIWTEPALWSAGCDTKPSYSFRRWWTYTEWCRNLADDRFRLLVAVDEITDELRRIVEYVNRHTDADLQLLALQLEYRRDGDVEILLPTIYGEESAQTREKAAATETTEETLFAALRERCSPTGCNTVQQLYQWSVDSGMRFYWGRGRYPSLNAWMDADKGRIYPWSTWASPHNPSISINFEYMLNKGLALERLDAFLIALERIPGVGSRLKGVWEADYKKRPGIPIDPILSSPGTMDAIIAALTELKGSGEQAT